MKCIICQVDMELVVPGEMSLECQCDKCRKLFNSSEIYCGDCVAELESNLNEAQATIRELNSSVKDLMEKIDTH